MTIHEAYQQTLLQLFELYDDREAANIVDLVFEHITGFRKIDRIKNRQAELSAAQVTNINAALDQLASGKPVQYVLGECWFGDLKFFVDESVLIPRPETEELVHWILTDLPESTGQLQVLDIGTGSGCIPVTLKYKRPSWQITAIDVSAGALTVANKNALLNNVEVNYRHIDFLQQEEWQSFETFDVIVSNPPYIRKQEAALMHQNVLEHEPHLALFVEDDDALLFYRSIAAFAQTHLSAGGSIYVEINEALGTATVEMFEENGYHCELKADMQGKQRMIKARKLNK